MIEISLKFLRTLSRLDTLVFLKVNAIPHWGSTNRLSPIIDIWYYFVIFSVFLLQENWLFIVKILIIAIVVNSIMLKRIFKKGRPGAFLSELTSFTSHYQD